MYMHTRSAADVIDELVSFVIAPVNLQGLSFKSFPERLQPYSFRCMGRAVV